jgi:hypothetical protein
MHKIYALVVNFSISLAVADTKLRDPFSFNDGQPVSVTNNSTQKTKQTQDACKELERAVAADGTLIVRDDEGNVRTISYGS